MVIVRESPRKKAPNADKAWPPRSPLEALLSSPSGRKRYEDKRARNSVSPSPVKRRKIDTTSSPGKSLMESFPDEDGDEDEDEDEDEETLQLKIKAYEAKLKLKRLQRSKSKINGADRSNELNGSSETSTQSRLAEAVSQPFRNFATVPASPPRERQTPVQPVSPARVLLGLENRAADVSLKRPRYKLDGSDNSPKKSRSDLLGGRQRLQDSPALSDIKSFGERIAESRASQRELAAKKERIENSRSRGFGLASASSQPTSTPSTSLSGSTVISSTAKRVSGKETLGTSNQSIPSPLPPTPTAVSGMSASTILEPYSGFHLKDRQIDSSSLTRALKDKRIYSIPQLLKEVKAPDYEPPDCENDYVVVGILAHKSTPYEQRIVTQTATGTSDPDAPKPVFMVLKLTDLEWEIDLFLFRSSVEAFYRVPVGTVVAVLNPGIMKPKPHAIHSGAFSLSLSSSDDVLLEIGLARDLGFCNAKKGNGKECMQWIDGRKTEVCEYHISLKVDKARKGRMEFSTMSNRPGSSGANYKGQGASNKWNKGKGQKGKSGLLPEGKQYSSSLQETYYIAPGSNLTKLLDDNDADVSAWQRGTTKEEILKKRERDQAKERDLAKKLVSLGTGGGQGGAYLKARIENSKNSATSTITPGAAILSAASNAEDPFAPRDAASLGLLSNSAASVSLASVSKRKHGLASSKSSQPIGWGGAYKQGLLLPPSSPTKKQEDGDQKEKKRARFMLEAKGIREPGRESLGTAQVVTAAKSNDFDDDDDDDLEIVR